MNLRRRRPRVVEVAAEIGATDESGQALQAPVVLLEVRAALVEVRAQARLALDRQETGPGIKRKVPQLYI